ncbi:MAG: family 16 glycosylhydrolase [Planctomycetaceae bacterium]|nr:family 16 glycosylhydrolase [Planctomycetaceae bacterium]
MSKPILLFILLPACCFAGFSADLDGDKYVGLSDLVTMASYWLDNGNPGCQGDTGSDCNIDMEDFTALSQQWQWVECVAVSATASGQEEGPYAASNAVDGSMSTRWSSSFYDNQWIQIDYGVSRTSYGVTLYWENAYARVYNVVVSENGSDWTTIYSTSNSDGGTDDITWPLRSMRYLRINCITRALPYGSSLYEIVLKSDDVCHTPVINWQLVWSDEFDGPSINTANWNWEIGRGNPSGWGNEELEYYTDSTENSYIENGSLVIAALKNTQEPVYTSARMTTKNKHYFKYGRMEARLKLPALEVGIWPAFWMMPQDSVYGGWAASGEIDIMEAVKEPYTVYGTIHYGGVWDHNVNTGGSYSNGTNFSQDYHVYALEWEPTQMRWYVDDVLYLTQTSWYTEGYPYPAPFDQSFYFILNLAVGGRWPSYPSDSTNFPKFMYVDYIRVYQYPEL